MAAAQRPIPKVRSISCPNCGGSVELRGMGSSLHAVCINCLSVLDVTKPEIRIVQQFEAAMRRTPKIPLGTRGKFDNKSYEVIGFQTRAIYVDGEEYSWDEYVLYNPFQGFRYLTEYDGHWNDVVSIPEIPQPDSGAAVRLGNERYKIFQRAHAKTIFVMGEFPWRVQVNDIITTEDYVLPPYSVAAETTNNEITWSKATYVPAAQIWQTFQLKTSPPPAKGVYSNQPNPYGSTKPLWAMFLLFSLLMLVGLIFTLIVSRNDVAFQARYSFIPNSGEPSFVTPVFELKGGEQNVKVEIATDLDNGWTYFAFALINDATGTAYDFGKEISSYRGRDSDGDWAEGNRNDSVTIGGVPGGRYYLRVEPETEKSFAVTRVEYQIKVKRGVAVIWPFFVAWPFLLLFPMWGLIRRGSFETQRWSESDPGGTSESGASATSSGDDDD